MLTEEPPVAEPEEGSVLKALSGRLALLNVIKARVEAETKKARADMESALREARRKTGTRSVDVTLPDPLAPEGEAVVARVDFNKDGDPMILIAPGQDSAALEWVATHHPEQIQEIVRPAFLKSLLEKRLVRSGTVVVDSKTGEVVPWARIAPGAPGAMTVKFPAQEDGKEALLAAWLGGLLPGVQVTALPAPPPPEVWSDEEG